MKDQQCLTPHQDLQGILAETQPRSVVYAGASLTPLLNLWQERHQERELLALPQKAPHQAFPLPRLYDLALVSGVLEHLSAEHGRLLLGQLRNMGAQQLAVVVSEQAPWSFNDFIALGFVRQQQYPQQPGGQALFTYDIASYNRKRSWNTPEYWANPEMWDKARW
ncbi:MAG: hypothetical protein EA349_10175 [Halomonadaceae bacterium]|nr:MAG: hypothetical protein EA349_10175 [Halomonadaceae bacterium]